MRLKLGNLLAVVFITLGLGVFLKMRLEILDCVGAIMSIGPGNTPADQLKGCLALAILGVCLISALRLIISENQK